MIYPEGGRGGINIWWVLMTLGTHYLRYDAERDQLSSTSLAPLMYLMLLMSKHQVESGSEVHLGSNTIGN